MAISPQHKPAAPTILNRFEGTGSLIDTIDLEQCILASALVSTASLAYACELLDLSSFQYIFHYDLFEKLKDAFVNKTAPDVFSIIEELSQEAIPVKEYVFELMEYGIQNPQIELLTHDYCKALREKQLVNTVANGCIDLCSNLSTGSRYEPLVTPLRTLIAKSDDLVSPNEERSYMDALTDAYDAYGERMEKCGIIGRPTGFAAIDNRLSGLQNGKMYVLAARPSMGKTALAGQIALNVAKQKNGPVLFFSLEMTPAEIAARLMSIESGVDLSTTSTHDLPKLSHAISTLGELNIIIPDVPTFTNVSLSARATREAVAHGAPALIVVDYIQLIRSAKSNANGTRQEDVAEFSRDLKSLARELCCPVLALSQLSRAVESRVDKHPVLSDLRESGSIEQDADVVAFLYRDDYYNRANSQKPGIAEFDIAKNRTGPLGVAELIFNRQTTSFTNSYFL